MAYPDDEFPSTSDSAPSPFTVQSVYPAQPGATNVPLAMEFLARHRGDMAQREPQISGNFDQMQLNVDSMTKMLDDTVNSIKSAKSGRSNLAMMAMGAGMMTNTGNFGSQLGAGFGAMVPTIQKQREQDEASELNLAQLGMRKAMLQNAPLEAKLAYMKAMQTGDQSAVRAIEQALIRAQATSGSGSAADRARLADDKILKDVIQNSLNEARRQVDTMAKEMDWTAEEREAEVQRRFAQNLRLAKATGMNIPDEAITRVNDAIAGGPTSRAPGTLKTFVDLPTGQARDEASFEAGLPATPAGYPYDMIGRKQKSDTLVAETKNYQKESKDWDTQSKVASDMQHKIDRIEFLLNKNPKLTGPWHGIPNQALYNLSDEARELDALFKGIQLHSVPQGQGAVSNMERDLFALASPNMTLSAPSNKSLLDIQREIFKRDKDRREFFSEYFGKYRTIAGMIPAWDRYADSSAGRAFTRDASGSPVINKDRMTWREYFKSERSPPGPPVPQRRAAGGPIRLGSEFD